MIRRLRLYREYRRQGLRRAWSLAGMWPVAWGAVKVMLLGMAIVAALMFAARQAQAIQDAAENRVAARLSSQEGEIDALRRIVAACVGDPEGAVYIGGELHLCHAVPTGIRRSE